LEEEREAHKMRLGNVNETIIAGHKHEEIRHISISDQYQLFDKEHDHLNDVIETVQIAENRASDSKSEVDKLAADINATSQRVNKLSELSGQGIREVTDKGMRRVARLSSHGAVFSARSRSGGDQRTEPSQGRPNASQ
jgi:hypothetical protein